MRRLLLILFMVVLPVQFTWGAAAPYCSHETDNAVSHVGHHSHVHKAAVVGTDAVALFASGDDLDCGYCHLGCAQPLASVAFALPVTLKSVHVSQQLNPNSFHAPDCIDRPNWSLAV